MSVVGDLYPMAEILGVDLSPIQPSWVPPNVQFTVDDLESSWLRPTNHFDYIHSRHIIMGIKDWPKLLRKTLEHLKPGGWLELQEIYHYPQCHDGTMPPEHPVARFWGLIVQALAALGVNFEATILLAEMMKEAGFVNVSTRIFHIPIGTWPRNKVLKLVGLYWRTILIDGLEPIALGPFTRGLGWSRSQVDGFLEEVRTAYLDASSHSHMPLYVVCGQKPEVGVSYQ
jgi:SAM-dependent methyltransferase